MKENMKKDYKLVLNTLFEKNLFHIYQSSFSIRTENDRFMINKKDTIFCEEDIFTEIHYKKDLSWQDASKDAHIHSYIYQKVSTAKCIAHIFSTNLVAYSLYHNSFNPIDYYGINIIGRQNIYNLQNHNNLSNQIENIIFPKLQSNNIFIIKGYGAYLYERDVKELAKKALILENSAQILLKIADV